MPVVPLLCPAVACDTYNPASDTCFACDPPYRHRRVWIPDGPTPRTLVLCFDGTGDSFDNDNSNVVQFLAMLKKDDPTNQLVYYQAGIGTYTNNVLKTPIIEAMSKKLDAMMIAYDLPDHVKDGYLFLMQNYRAKDRICIFGFSRGACTARALAGMLQKVGLLPPCNFEQLPFAYSMYARSDQAGLDLSSHFKRTFSIDVRIKFLGVWDTVQSVGVIPKHLPFSTSNNAILHFRHALALDECRVRFIPSFYAGGIPKRTDSEVSEHSEVISQNGAPRMEREWSGASSEYENQVNAMTGPDTDVEEVFFAGAHCDVGGGSVANGERHSLARIPLRWMIRECFKLETGIVFDAHMLKNEVGLDIDSILEVPQVLPPEIPHLTRADTAELEGFSLRQIPVVIISALGSPFLWIWDKLSHIRSHNPPKAPPTLKGLKPQKSEGEATEERNDALSPIYDQLEKYAHWKVMEWIPWPIKKQGAEAEDNFWAYKLVWNRGKGRKVYHQVMPRGMKVHRSVKTRIESFRMGKEPYLPKIRCVVDGETRCLSEGEWLDENQVLFEWVG